MPAPVPVPPRAFTTREAIRASHPRVVRRSTIARITRGAHAPAALAERLDVRVAGVQAVVPRCAASHWTALALHGLDLLPPREQRGLHVVVPPSVVAPRRDGVVARIARLSPGEVVVVDGCRVTSPLRTLTDLAREAPREDAVVAADWLLQRERCSLDEVRASLDHLRGWRGVRRAREVLGLVDPASESVGETRLRLDLVLAGLPTPESQVVVRDERGRFVARLDLAYRERKIALEYDGRQHAGTLHADHTRQNALEALGWVVLRFTAEHLRRPGHAAATVGRVLGLRSAA